MVDLDEGAEIVEVGSVVEEVVFRIQKIRVLKFEFAVWAFSSSLLEVRDAEGLRP